MRTLEQIANDLISLANRGFAASGKSLPDPSVRFADELGIHLEIDALLVQSVHYQNENGDDHPSHLPLGGTSEISPEVSLLAQSLLKHPHLPGEVSWSSTDGLLIHHPKVAIEVFTELELCALHALFAIGVRFQQAGDFDQSKRVWDRCFDAAQWHVRELQPDNATQRPWGAHVFYACAQTRNEYSTQAHADALVHGALVNAGMPGARACLILLDAGRTLRAYVQDA